MITKGLFGAALVLLMGCGAEPDAEAAAAAHVCPGMQAAMMGMHAQGMPMQMPGMQGPGMEGHAMPGMMSMPHAMGQGMEGETCPCPGCAAMHGAPAAEAPGPEAPPAEETPAP